MKLTYTIKKTLNNNVVIVSDENNHELIMIGNGIGFSKKKGDPLSDEQYEKVFKLVDEKEQELYKQLLHNVDSQVVQAINDAIRHIQEKLDLPVHEHIHIALTDHIAFAIKRVEQGFDIKNPFLHDTALLYPQEFKIAEEVVDDLNKKLGVNLPKSEVGFVTLHIHSAVSNRSLQEINHHSQLIKKLVEVIESQLEVTVDKESIDYARLVSHLRRVIDRVIDNDLVEVHEKLAEVLKKEYPVCYNLSWKLVKIIQQTIRKPIPEAEIVYITIHLQRLTKQ
ncbi:glucose PTS transporter transcription antiterminator GlcT [Alteribacter keqinensis]|uniref:PRD domain-containing protein n=1 Tax=Alteribacter keqinensis TaxID=2483800 RepID=A0A3M7TXF3_9BACI|nr:PRD domain-containing protein [Alteribacter keqinensis]RNA70256.1 PRD domain-containing protein [Alteribacter keqinensis]